MVNGTPATGLWDSAVTKEEEMSGLKRFSGRTLRPVNPARRILSWLILLVLVTGAAAYSQGSRYSIIPSHGTLSSASYENPADASPPATTAASSDEASGGEASGVLEKTSCLIDSNAAQQECERRSAPRSQPAPLRTAFDPPAAAPGSLGAGVPVGAAWQQERNLPALTVIELSVSRT